MGKNKHVPMQDLWKVIGTDGSIYLKRENRYLTHGEQLVLEPHEAETLLAAGLVEKVQAPTPHEIEEIQEN